MLTISLDLRERILTSYDQKEGTREEIAQRYRVSLAWSKSSSNSAVTPAIFGPAIIDADADPRSCLGTGKDSVNCWNASRT